MTALLRAEALRLPGRLLPTDLRLGAGQLVALVGPNGGGKTSLLRCLGDVEGEADLIQIAGAALKDAPPARRAQLLSYLPAGREMVWPISVGDVLALGLSRPDSGVIDDLLAQLELTALRDRPINSLSTGQRARALIGRALASRPNLLLLDEPLSNLDPYWGLRLMEILRAAIGHNASALVALHDLNQLEAFDRVLLVGGGRLLLDGSPQEVLGSELLNESFGVERRGGRWTIRRRAEDPRSLP